MDPPTPLVRLAGLTLALAVVGLLAVASQLTPSESGLGTHQQLGLPPCSIRMLFGVRCPSCGMTTSWAYFFRGDVVSSARSNLAGLMLAIYALASLSVSLPMAVAGRMPHRRRIRAATLVLGGIVAVALLEWSWRLFG